MNVGIKILMMRTFALAAVSFTAANAQIKGGLCSGVVEKCFTSISLLLSGLQLAREDVTVVAFELNRNVK